ncbi:MAG: insulinase family protein [Bacteroidetes bacterium]|nr:insulinase family protein [Bacteroidota bacterium]
MIDRKSAPAILPAKKINITNPDYIALDNGMPLYAMGNDHEEVVKIEVLFDAGSDKNSQQQVAEATCNLSDDGHVGLSASAVAEKFEYYGASIETLCEYHLSSMSLYAMAKHVHKLMPVFCDLLQTPEFATGELENYKVRNIQQLKVQSEKTEYMARMRMRNELFGDHVYGAVPAISHFENLSREQLQNFHASYYATKPFIVIVSGCASEALIKQVNKTLGSIKCAPGSTANLFSNQKHDLTLKQVPQKIKITKQGALQSAVRIACAAVNKSHPDYFKLNLLINVLGGYFGSRLMSNIREDKGYTYGIGSSLVAYRDAAIITIATEVGTDVTAATLEEIYKEINKLCSEEIPAHELQVVKNYMSGSMLRLFDGTFARAERFRMLLTNSLTNEYYQNFIASLHQISSKQLIETANQYLLHAPWTEVVCGD